MVVLRPVGGSNGLAPGKKYHRGSFPGLGAAESGSSIRVPVGIVQNRSTEVDEALVKVW